MEDDDEASVRLINTLLLGTIAASVLAKLTGLVGWPWVVVLVPVWAPLLIVALALVIYAFFEKFYLKGGE